MASSKSTNNRVLNFKYDPDPKSDIHTIFAFYKYIEWPLCLKIMDTKNLKELNIVYKLSTIFWILLVQLGIICCAYTDVIIILSNASISLLATTIISYVSEIVFYIVSVLYGVFLVPDIAMKIYIRFTKLDRILHLIDDQRRSALLKMLIIIHVFQAIAVFFLIYVDLNDWSNFSLIFTFWISITHDVKLIIFFAIINSIAVRFEILNSAMVNSKIFKRKIDFDLKSGMMAEVWKNKNNFDERSNMDLSSYLAIYNNLAELINDVNVYYGVQVSLIINIFF